MRFYACLFPAPPRWLEVKSSGLVEVGSFVASDYTGKASVEVPLSYSFCLGSCCEGFGFFVMM